MCNKRKITDTCIQDILPESCSWSLSFFLGSHGLFTIVRWMMFIINTCRVTLPSPLGNDQETCNDFLSSDINDKWVDLLIWKCCLLNGVENVPAEWFIHEHVTKRWFSLKSQHKNGLFSPESPCEHRSPIRANSMLTHFLIHSPIQ